MRSITLLLLVLFVADSASAQRSPVSAVIKVANAPQFGLEGRLTPTVSARALTAFATDFDNGFIVVNVAGLVQLHEKRGFRTRVGLSTTIRDFEEFALFGILFSVEQAINDKVVVFGEVALDADFGDGLGVVRTAQNTGVGVRVGL